MGTAGSPVDLPDEVTLLNLLSHLPPPSFERIVYIFDKHRDVPGRETAQATRATDLLRVVEYQHGGVEKLWDLIREYDIRRGQAKADNNINDPGMVYQLIGILIDPDVGEVGVEIARYAYAIIKESIFSDMYSQPDEDIVHSLVWNLKNLDEAPNQSPDLLAFAVVCHDYAAGLGITELKGKLKAWIDAICLSTYFNLEAIRGKYRKWDYRRVHRPAIEIVWPLSIIKQKSAHTQPEAYIRWGGMRERVEPLLQNLDSHKMLSEILEFISKDQRARYLYIDHVELLLEASEMNSPWEYLSDNSTDAEDPQWQPYPVVVRLYSEIFPDKDRNYPKDRIKYLDIVCSEQHSDRFLELVQNTGIFVASCFEHENNQPCQKIKRALLWTSIGIWTRTICKDDDTLRNDLVGCPVEDVPSRVHRRRLISPPGSVWRHATVLFDPHLPAFDPAHAKCNSKYQQLANAALR
jgi:hypothetical protein